VSFICCDWKGRELSTEECEQQLSLELKKSDSERDLPLIKKLWSHKGMFELRRKKIAELGDGRVKELVTLFPLLHQLTFVSFFL